MANIDRNDFRTSSKHKSSSGRRRHRSHGRLFRDPAALIKPILLIVIIVALLIVIKLIPTKEAPAETTAAQTEVMQTAETTETPETTEAVKMYKTTDILNVRSSPDTDHDRIGALVAGAEVVYLRDHDEKWAVIRYNGEEAYVAKEYLTPMSE